MHRPDRRQNSAGKQPELLDEVDALTSALLDGELDEDSKRRLEQLLQQSEEARTRYMKMVRLHVDLAAHFQPASDVEPPLPIVLGQLGPDAPPWLESSPHAAD